MGGRRKNAKHEWLLTVWLGSSRAFKGSEAKEAAKRKTAREELRGGRGRERANTRRQPLGGGVVPENAKFVIERNTGREYMAAFRSGDGFY